MQAGGGEMACVGQRWDAFMSRPLMIIDRLTVTMHAAVVMGQRFAMYRFSYLHIWM